MANGQSHRLLTAFMLKGTVPEKEKKKHCKCNTDIDRRVSECVPVTVGMV